MDFELDDVVEDLFDLRVQFFAQGVGAEGQLFESGKGEVSMWESYTVWVDFWWETW